MIDNPLVRRADGIYLGGEWRTPAPSHAGDILDYTVGVIFYDGGQMGSATSRLVLDAAIADDLTDRLVARSRRLKADSPFADGCALRPRGLHAFLGVTHSSRRRAASP